MEAEKREEARAERVERLEKAQDQGEAAYQKQLEKEKKLFAREELARRKAAEKERFEAEKEKAAQEGGEGRAEDPAGGASVGGPRVTVSARKGVSDRVGACA